MAVFRHKIYLIMKNTGGRSQDPLKQEEQRNLFVEAAEKKPEYLKSALILYGFNVDHMEPKEIDIMMREAYLDFYTHSLQEGHVGGPYNKRLQVEQKEHNQVLEKIMAGAEAMPQLEKNPLDSKDSDLSVDLKQLSGYTLKSSATFINQDKERVKISKGAMNLIDKFKKKKIDARPKENEIKEENEGDGDEEEAGDKQDSEAISEGQTEKVAEAPSAPEEVKAPSSQEEVEDLKASSEVQPQ